VIDSRATRRRLSTQTVRHLANSRQSPAPSTCHASPGSLVGCGVRDAVEDEAVGIR